MKRVNFKLVLPACLALGALLYACSKSFLSKPPLGAYTPTSMSSRAGVEGLLIGAYSMLDGKGGAGTNVAGAGDWVTAEDNWVWGGVCADDAHKGSDPGDQVEIVPLMSWSETPTNGWLDGKWSWGYDAIQRSNDVLRYTRLAKDMTPADTIEVTAEAKFLRAHYHMDLKKIFNQVPYVDENITYAAGNWRVDNTVDIWPMIEADLKYAMANLPKKQGDIGRANFYAAEAYLAKAYMFEQKFADAQPLLNDLITNGTTSAGKAYALVTNFNDNFNASTKNNTESVFAAQMSVNDNTGAANANAGDVLNYPYNNGDVPFVNCCGFYQPSFSLVNAFKTDPVTGLPDPDNYNNTDVRNDMGLKKTDAFTPYAAPSTAGEAVDPRLDWTVGRRGIPYLDWGVVPGVTWVRNQASAGPYLPIKNSPRASQNGTLTDKSSWTAGYSALNYNFIRFADILLWAAEVEVEIGSLDVAEGYVNQVRNRAANASGFVYQYADPTKPQNGFSATPAAHYVVKPYPAGFFTGQGQAGARKYVRFERRLELAMEGHRFFDLVRWGIADTELNAYVQHETHATNGTGSSFPYTLLNGATFKKGVSEYFAIPQAEIDASHDPKTGKATLTQNTGY